VSPRQRLVALARRATFAIAVLAGCRLAGRGDSQEVRALTDQMIAGSIGKSGLAYDIVYRLYVPPSYEASRKYPLLLFLHGSGALGNDNRRQILPELAQLNSRIQAQEPVFLLAPQCPAEDKWVTGAHEAPHLNFSQETRPESDALKLVLFLLDELERKYSIDPDRIYVTGHSSGAAGTWDIISRRAHERFAAAIPVTGPGDPSRASTIATLPIWAFHGARDQISPAENSRQLVAALRALGSSVRYTEYTDIGHDTLGRAYREPELVPWLLAQRRARGTP
jgi:predicted peptidase